MKKFNIRCYAIIVNEKNEILLSDEERFGHSFTKFIGGGLEFGEGTKECLQREIKEELNLNAEIGDLFYVNDFYQPSLFNKDDQIIAFYYLINQINFKAIPIEQKSTLKNSEGESFRWKKIDELKESDVTFPIDKIVVKKFKKKPH